METSSRLLVELTSWTLIHFVWQGVLVGVVAFASLRSLRLRSPDLRYAVALSYVGVLAICPVFTFAAAWREHAARTAVVVTQPVPNTQLWSQSTAKLPEPALVESLPEINSVGGGRFFYEVFHLAVVACWFIGQLACSVRLVFSSYSVYRLRRVSLVVDQAIQNMAQRMADDMGIACPRVLCSGEIECALACGFFRETVIVPVGWLTEMTAEMIESVLAHELAHLRRYDLWVNLLQRFVETALFFHPVVWWLSSRVRRERELCCDAMAVRQTQNKHNYARTLEYVAQASLSREQLLATQMGDDRMSLLRRVHCVLEDTAYRQESSWLPVIILGIGIVAGAISFQPFSQSIAQEVEPTVAQAEPASGNAPMDAPVAAQENSSPLLAESLQSGAVKARTSGPTGADWKLGEYIIEPPDILKIGLVRPKLRSPRRIVASDTLRVTIPVKDKRNPRNVAVADDGTITLIPVHKLQVAGLSEKEVARRIKYAVQLKTHQSVEVQVVRATSNLANEGQYLVAPDGTVNLGNYGPVYVAGLTIEKAKSAVAERLFQYYEELEVDLDVSAINSKFFYIVIEDSRRGDQVLRIPTVGSDTVSDVTANYGGIVQPDQHKIWISRPSTNGSNADQILLVNWNAITRGTDTTTNYPLLPGDRLYISRTQDSKEPRTQFTGPLENSAELPQHDHPLAPLGSTSPAPYLSQYGQAVSPPAATANLANVPSKKEATQSVHRLPLMASMTSGGRASVLPPPTQEELLKLVEVAKPQSALLRDRENVMVAIELVSEHVDPPRFYPLVGPAQLHHAHYKVTLSVKRGEKANVVETFDVDHQHLHASKKLQESATKGEVYVESYHVGDLITPIAKPEFSKTGEIKRDQDAKPDFATLTELIKSTVAPDSWDELGGIGAIEAFEGNLSLVIANTGEVHDQVRELLAQLRTLQERQVEFRSTELSIPKDLIRKLGLVGKTCSVLTNAEWQKIIESAERHPKARVFETSKMRIFNGQFYSFEIAGGREVMVQPVVSDDRQQVRMTFATDDGESLNSTFGTHGKAGFLLSTGDGKFKLISAHPHTQSN